MFKIRRYDTSMKRVRDWQVINRDTMNRRPSLFPVYMQRTFCEPRNNEFAHLVHSALRRQYYTASGFIRLRPRADSSSSQRKTGFHSFIAARLSGIYRRIVADSRVG